VFLLTHLGVSGFHPVLIKVMMPEVALVTIGRVVLPAVDAARGMRTQHTFSHGGTGGVTLVFPLQQPDRV